MKLDELTRSYPLDPQALDAVKSFYKKIPSIPRDEDGEIDTDTLDYESDYELVSKMKKLGWTESYIEGWYSNVFVKPGESYVLKVNKREDRPYAWFAFLTRKFPSPHFPKIGNVKIIRVEKETYRIYAIEKLTPFYDETEGKTIARFCKAAVKGDDVLSYFQRMPSVADQAISLYTACRVLRNNNNKNYYPDIHRKNIMLRGNIVVITDPFTIG